MTPGLYFVRVSGYGGTVGDVALTVAAPGVITSPPNDDPFRSGVQEIAIGYTHLDTNRGATAGGFPPPACGTAAASVPDVWRTVIVPEAGTLTIDTEGSGFDTVFGVYTLNGVGEVDPTMATACNDDDPSNAAGDGSSRVSFEATPGVAYLVQTTSSASVRRWPRPPTFGSRHSTCYATDLESDGAQADSFLRVATNRLREHGRVGTPDLTDVRGELSDYQSKPGFVGAGRFATLPPRPTLERRFTFLMGEGSSDDGTLVFQLGTKENQSEGLVETAGTSYNPWPCGGFTDCSPFVPVDCDEQKKPIAGLDETPRA